jgi:type VI secretion system secreted protein Hcp
MKNLYLKLSGPDIKGESADKEHGQWIELSAIHHEMLQPTAAARSTAGGHAVGRTEHGDLTIVKDLDVSSTSLYQAVSGGTTFQSAQIDCYRAAGDGKRVKYLEIQLSKVLISKVAMGIDEAFLPVETVSFRYAAIQWKYVKQNVDGSQGGVTQGAWSLTKNDKTFSA